MYYVMFVYSYMGKKFDGETTDSHLRFDSHVAEVCNYHIRSLLNDDVAQVMSSLGLTTATSFCVAHLRRLWRSFSVLRTTWSAN